MKVVGYATVKNKLTGTPLRVGDDSLYAGKRLKVLERTDDGDCFCINSDASGLGEVVAADIEIFQPLEIPKTGNAAFDSLMQMMAGNI